MLRVEREVSSSLGLAIFSKSYNNLKRGKATAVLPLLFF
ncbi:hypothetical protein SAMN06295967_10791 [Belliella buryatensis]|uniref:Uncharacterized protein n=1 Tax=Belliella buryatensis TaxID=1500549 RepID=A0A239DIY1_9BACT|nr:hypothetical protein SAMN06295967_10791 [Belliella buryatensis]